MPAMSWCELKVTGLLGGPPDANVSEIDAFKRVFPQVCPPAPPKTSDPEYPFDKNAPWPNGLVLPNYKAGIWHSDGELLKAGDITKALRYPPYDHMTQLVFHVQLIGMYSGSIFSNREYMLKEVEWFYEYCEYQWLKDLKAHIKDLNEFYKKSNRVINTVDVREWKWYCGDGAGD